MIKFHSLPFSANNNDIQTEISVVVTPNINTGDLLMSKPERNGTIKEIRNASLKLLNIVDKALYLDFVNFIKLLSLLWEFHLQGHLH